MKKFFYWISIVPPILDFIKYSCEEVMRFADNRKYFEEWKQFEEANRRTVSTSDGFYPIDVPEYGQAIKVETKKKGKRGKNGSI